MELEGKVAIVTGASRGIGRAYAVALARAGARVALAARTFVPPPAELVAGVEPGRRHVYGLLPGTVPEVVEAIRAEGGTAIGVRCDVRREEDIRRLVDETLAAFGQIDILVNNAAIYPRLDPLAIPVEEWDDNLNVNLRGAYLTMRETLPHMIARRRGSVINITSSTAGVTRKGALGHEGLLAYGVSKAALNRLTTFLAEEMRPYGIAVNALSPGGVLSEGWDDVKPPDWDAARDGAGWHPATAEALGPALIYLAQQTAATRTGQILHTNAFGREWP